MLTASRSEPENACMHARGIKVERTCFWIRKFTVICSVTWEAHVVNYVGRKSSSVRDECVTCAHYSARRSSWPSYTSKAKNGVRYYAVDTVLYGA